MIMDNTNNEYYTVWHCKQNTRMYKNITDKISNF